MSQSAVAVVRNTSADSNRKFARLRIVLSRIGVVGALILYVFCGPELPGHLPMVSESLFVAGVVLTIAGSLGRLWCASVISGRKNSEVVNVGPYSLCRNPLYFFSFMGMVGVCCMTRTILFPLIFIVCFALYYPRVIRNEEAHLFRKFGDKFTEFAKATPVFIPRFSGYRGVESVVISSKSFAREVLHSGLFLLIIPGMYLTWLLRGAEILPTLLRLW